MYSLDKEVDVGGASCREIGGTVVAHRSVGFNLRREQAHGGGEMMPVRVAAACADVQHRRRAATIAGRHQPLVEVDIAHRIVVERREEPHQVAHVVNGGAVEQNLVLCRCAASHLIAAQAVALHLHARQELQTLDDIALAQHGRQLAHRLHVHLLHTYLQVVDTTLRSLRAYDDLIQRVLHLGALVGYNTVAADLPSRLYTCGIGVSHRQQDSDEHNQELPHPCGTIICQLPILNCQFSPKPDGCRRGYPLRPRCPQRDG